MEKIVVIVGPTAVGKSTFALELSEHIGGEIITADSMQVYRYMDIGTAKPSREDRARVPHHLIDIVDPDECFNAARYRTEARRTIEGIVQRGTIPVVVGGTGLYIKALTRGLFPDPTARTPKTWNERLQSFEWLGQDPWKQLADIDPRTAASINPHDRVRAQRALEVYQATGVSIRTLQASHAFRNKTYDTLVLGLTMDRGVLYQRIRERIDRMVEAGLIDEVRSLLDRGYSEQLPSMKALGYRHLTGVVLGRMKLEEALHRYKRDTIRYAKRQMTWFRHQETPLWYEPPYPLHEIVEQVKRFLGDN